MHSKQQTGVDKLPGHQSANISYRMKYSCCHLAVSQDPNHLLAAELHHQVKNDSSAALHPSPTTPPQKFVSLGELPHSHPDDSSTPACHWL